MFIQMKWCCDFKIFRTLCNSKVLYKHNEPCTYCALGMMCSCKIKMKIICFPWLLELMPSWFLKLVERWFNLFQSLLQNSSRYFCVPKNSILGVLLSFLLSPYSSALDFCNSPVWIIEFDELDFFSYLHGYIQPSK